ncbi:uro-adherence factor A-like isoform X2 [Palaemon carinicauda]|uniref:uro-adherence factor A-like isoform X2 n=1 Tax=Palaemon carinicauda TaxID=392227 RepID=UPI0035B63C10
MFEVLVIGLVGLTYTCVQTLFFLNCLNSRRREQRRLEKAYRESIRKLKGEVEGAKCNVLKDGLKRDRKENGSDVINVENGSERGGGVESPEEDDGQDQLVTRVVVKSGKEVLPTPKPTAEEGTSLLSVKVHKAVVKVSDPLAENGRFVSEIPDKDCRDGKRHELNFTDRHEGSGTTTAAVLAGYNITVNSNMIEISGEGGSDNNVKEPIYESIDGEPLSILTDMTVCEDQETLNDNQTHNRKSTESMSVDMLDGLEHQRGESLIDRHYSSNTTDVISVEGFQEVQDSHIQINDICSIEDEMESLDVTSYMHSKREDINLVNTISQILYSPHESIEPGSENLTLDSPEPRINGFELRTKRDNLTLSSRSHLANHSTDERTLNPLVTSDVSGLPLDDYLGKHRLGESCEEVTCYKKSLSSTQVLNDGVPLRPPKGKGSTWTLPRASKRVPDGYASLSRVKAKTSISNRDAMRKRSHGNNESPHRGQTSLGPGGGNCAKRDEALGGGPISAPFNTCHSTPDIAEAATLPADTTTDSTATTIISRDESISSSKMTEYTSPSAKEAGTFTLRKKRPQRGDVSESNLDNRNSAPKVMDNDIIPTAALSDEHTDSEESADSLYYTASDHTNSDAYSENRGDSEESFEGLVYEPIEAPKEVFGLKEQPSSKDSNQNDKMSVSQSESFDKSQHLTHSFMDAKTQELNNNNESETNNKSLSKRNETAEDDESIEFESHYESVIDFDHHQDSGYESPVKADIHSSDDAASTISTSSVENHYEDIDPSRMGQDRGRQSSSRRGRALKVSYSNDSIPKKEERDDDEDSVEARQRQRLQELDDLIAGVPPPDYDARRPHHNGSTTPDARANGRPGKIPPPPEFGDTSSGSGDSISVHRPVHSTHSVPPNSSSASSSPVSSSQQRSPLLRTASEPTPPPPPPLPAHTPSPRSSPAVMHRISPQSRENSSTRLNSNENFQRSFDSGSHSDGLDEESVVKPSEFIRRNSQRGENGSFRGHKKVDRPVSLPIDVAEHYGKIMSSGKDKPPTTTQDDSGSATLPAKPHLSTGKSLPFIPPKFPSQPSGSGLIKPSEYLRSLGGTTGRSPMGNDVKSLVAMHSSESLSSSFDNHDHSSHNDSQPASMPVGPLPSIPESTEEDASKNHPGAPPPPPAPPVPATSSSPAPPTSSSANTLIRSNTMNSSSNNNKSKLPTISVTDLQSVQLRKTENKAPKPTSVPIRIPLSPEPALAIAKDDVIAELKMGVDITGIKKLKSERAKEEVKNCDMEKKELEKQFSAVNFVDQIPEKDNAGNRIPEWKRQMLARKAAERAKKTAEEQLQQQLEEKRLQAIPPWKRQLLLRRDDDGKRSSLYIPKVEEAKKIHVVNSPEDITRLAQRHEMKDLEDNQSSQAENGQENSPDSSSDTNGGTSSQERKEEEEEEEPQMPWRSNLRKTRSRLSLLE